MQDLQLGLLEIFRALPDARFEHLVLGLQREIEVAHLEEVADAQDDLGRVERLVDEVLGAHREGALLQMGVGVRRDEDDGQVAVGGQQRRELVEHPEAIEVGHVEVEQDQVGTMLLEQRARLLRVRGRDDALESGAPQQPVDDVDVLDLIVNGEDARLWPRELRHA